MAMDILIKSEQDIYDELIKAVNKYIYNPEFKEEVIELVDNLVEEIIEGGNN